MICEVLASLVGEVATLPLGVPVALTRDLAFFFLLLVVSIEPYVFGFFVHYEL